VPTVASENEGQLKSYYTAMLLGVAYSSSLGGVGTLIGAFFRISSFLFRGVFFSYLSLILYSIYLFI
jgi:hypothetical protein